MFLNNRLLRFKIHTKLHISNYLFFTNVGKKVSDIYSNGEIIVAHIFFIKCQT